MSQQSRPSISGTGGHSATQYAVYGQHADGTPLSLDDAEIPLIPDDYDTTRDLAAALQRAFPGTVIIIEYADTRDQPEPYEPGATISDEPLLIYQVTR
ncbi:hypothetical protein SMC26_23580 [Actinomadura fulvescens]|uniref:hypothetical protein n=1 Tax=Actinomadura fulvescens TaxID=46160 RepID=UPI0031DF72B8